MQQQYLLFQQLGNISKFHLLPLREFKQIDQLLFP